MGRRAESSCRRPDVRLYRDAFGKMPMRLPPWVALPVGKRDLRSACAQLKRVDT
jgi:hypothetical protein